jgi:hypothetical protein
MKTFPIDDSRGAALLPQEYREDLERNPEAVPTGQLILHWNSSCDVP